MTIDPKFMPKRKLMKPGMSSAELGQLGSDKFAYIRPISSIEFMEKFSEVEGLEPGMMLWGLFSANGDPLALADDPGGVLSNAHDLNLQPMSLH